MSDPATTETVDLSQPDEFAQDDEIVQALDVDALTQKAALVKQLQPTSNPQSAVEAYAPKELAQVIVGAKDWVHTVARGIETGKIKVTVTKNEFQKYDPESRTNKNTFSFGISFNDAPGIVSLEGMTVMKTNGMLWGDFVPAESFLWTPKQRIRVEKNYAKPGKAFECKFTVGIGELLGDQYSEKVVHALNEVIGPVVVRALWEFPGFGPGRAKVIEKIRKKNKTASEEECYDMWREDFKMPFSFSEEKTTGARGCFPACYLWSKMPDDADKLRELHRLRQLMMGIEPPGEGKKLTEVTLHPIEQWFNADNIKNNQPLMLLSPPLITGPAGITDPMDANTFILPRRSFVNIHVKLGFGKPSGGGDYDIDRIKCTLLHTRIIELGTGDSALDSIVEVPTMKPLLGERQQPRDSIAVTYQQMQMLGIAPPPTMAAITDGRKSTSSGPRVEELPEEPPKKRSKKNASGSNGLNVPDMGDE